MLTWPLDLGRLAAVAERCAEFETFFDPSIARHSDDHPECRHRAPTRWYTSRRCGWATSESSVYFAFENIGRMAVFGIAFPTPNPSIPVKASLPQTFLDIVAKQADRAQSA